MLQIFCVKTGVVYDQNLGFTDPPLYTKDCYCITILIYNVARKLHEQAQTTLFLASASSVYADMSSHKRRNKTNKRRL